MPGAGLLTIYTVVSKVLVKMNRPNTWRLVPVVSSHTRVHVLYTTCEKQDLKDLLAVWWCAADTKEILQTYIQTYIQTYRHTDIHTDRHTYIHTYIQTCDFKNRTGQSLRKSYLYRQTASPATARELYGRLTFYRSHRSLLFDVIIILCQSSKCARATPLSPSICVVMEILVLSFFPEYNL